MSRAATLTLFLAECAHAERPELWMPLLGLAAMSMMLKEWATR